MMSARTRPAFTALEMLFATAIFSLVMGGVCTFLVGSFRMTKGAFAETTLSLQLRETRERVLFKAIPTHHGTAWPGVLSGEGTGSGVEGGVKILLSAGGVNTATGAGVAPSGMNIHLVRHAAAGGGYLVNDGDTAQRSSWLRPMNASCVPGEWVTDKGGAMFVTLGGVVEGVGVTNRIVAPSFGRTQPTPSTSYFAEGS